MTIQSHIEKKYFDFTLATQKQDDYFTGVHFMVGDESCTKEFRL